MAEQMIDHVHAYFSGYTNAMMRSYFTIADKVCENELIRLEGISNLAMHHFGCKYGMEVPDMKENKLTYLDFR